MKLAKDYPIRLSCRLLHVPRSTLYYAAQPLPDDEAMLKVVLLDLAAQWPTCGYRRLTAMMPRDGMQAVNAHQLDRRLHQTMLAQPAGQVGAELRQPAEVFQHLRVGGRAVQMLQQTTNETQLRVIRARKPDPRQRSIAELQAEVDAVGPEIGRVLFALNAWEAEPLGQGPGMIG